VHVSTGRAVAITPIQSMLVVSEHQDRSVHPFALKDQAAIWARFDAAEINGALAQAAIL